jgi:hypothetical protein
MKHHISLTFHLGLHKLASDIDRLLPTAFDCCTQWIASTTILVLLVPLIIELDRESQIENMEKAELNVLTGPAGSSPSSSK